MARFVTHACGTPIYPDLHPNQMLSKNLQGDYEFCEDFKPFGLKLIESMSAMIPELICSIVLKSITTCFCFGMYCLKHRQQNVVDKKKNVSLLHSNNYFLYGEQIYSGNSVIRMPIFQNYGFFKDN